jgi:hypothetical protein
MCRVPRLCMHDCEALGAWGELFKLLTTFLCSALESMQQKDERRGALGA